MRTAAVRIVIVGIIATIVAPSWATVRFVRDAFHSTGNQNGHSASL